jgi:hypothetical protein
VVLKGGTSNYHWYVFDALAAGSGTWNTSALLGPNGQAQDLSHMTVYTNSGVPIAATPIPAAFWLFGSGVMGLLGLSRKCKLA